MEGLNGLETREPMGTKTSAVRKVPWDGWGYYNFAVATTGPEYCDGEIYRPDAREDEIYPDVHDAGTPAARPLTAASYDGDWTRADNPRAFGGSSMHSSTPGASATFTGEREYWGGGVVRFAWVATRGPDQGKAKVFRNGREVARVDLSTGYAGARRVVWQRRIKLGYTEDGYGRADKIRIEVVSGHVDIDAIATALTPGDP